MEVGRIFQVRQISHYTGSKTVAFRTAVSQSHQSQSGRVLRPRHLNLGVPLVSCGLSCFCYNCVEVIAGMPNGCPICRKPIDPFCVYFVWMNHKLRTFHMTLQTQQSDVFIDYYAHMI